LLFKDIKILKVIKDEWEACSNLDLEVSSASCDLELLHPSWTCVQGHKTIRFGSGQRSRSHDAENRFV